MLDLRRLRLLHELHTRGTVHAAAQALGYTPSAVSQQLGVLEREAGAPLLERVGRNVVLTPAGLVLVRHAEQLLAGMEAAQAELAATTAGRVAGSVRLAAFQSALLRIVAPAVRELATQHPDVRVEAAELEVEVALPALRPRHLDLVIGDEWDGQSRIAHSELQREALLRDQVRVVLPLGHPEAAHEHVSLASLARLPWGACHDGSGNQEMLVRVCRRLGGFEPDVRYRSDDLVVLLEFVRTTGSGALLPDLILGYGAPGVAVRPIVEGPIGREIFLFTRRHRTPAVAAVAAALHRAAAAA